MGSRSGFGGLTPASILACVLIPAFSFIRPANCRHTCSAEFRVSSFRLIAAGVRVAGFVAALNAVSYADTALAIVAASAMEIKYVAGCEDSWVENATIHASAFASWRGMKLLS